MTVQACTCTTEMETRRELSIQPPDKSQRTHALMDAGHPVALMDAVCYVCGGPPNC